ncbi:MAG: acriflavin resistance protein [Candidatus Marinimicrobia bacterium]|nr:acriflavin resistance protein [Candidatus Neomarinimicrobiota bacterium]
MKNIIRWFIANTVAANLLMIFIIIAGLFTLSRLRMEVFPDITIGIVNVTIVYPGASPEDIEESICVRVEEKIQGIDGVKRITSSSNEGYGSVNVEIENGEDINEIEDKIKTQIDAITSFPDAAEKPIIRSFEGSPEVITVAVHGHTDEKSLISIAEKVRDEINDLPEVTQTRLTKKPREISIEISENTLQKYGLSFDYIAGRIRSSSMDVPGGAIETSDGEILIRSQGQAYTGEEFGMIPVLSMSDGSTLLLKDIANIIDGFQDVEYDIKFNSEPAALIRVYRTGEQNALDIADAVHEYLAKTEPLMAPGISLTSWKDESVILRGRIELLTRNAYLGLCLVLIVLALFLKPKLAAWVSLGIPISFMGGFWLLPVFDISINMISLFTFILVLGIVVDDAIVVGENIHIFRKRGLSGKEAALAGAYQVAKPVIFAVLTTMVTFTPMMIVEGALGKIWRIIPVVTIVVLLFSLIESLTILPAHLAHINDEKSEDNFLSIWWAKIQLRIHNGLQSFIKKIYEPSLKWALLHRANTIAISISIFILTIGVVASGILKFSFFPPLEADIIIAGVEYPEGTPIVITKTGLEQVEESAFRLRDSLEVLYPDKKIFINMCATAGDQPVKTQSARGPGNLDASFFGSHLAECVIELAPGEERPLSAAAISKMWRELTGSIPGVRELTFDSDLFTTGAPIEVQLRSTDQKELREVTTLLKDKLQSYAGVFDIKDSFSAGKDEIKLRLRPEAQNYGINMASLARQVRQAFYGDEVQRIQRGRDEVKVFLRYPKNERVSLNNLEQMNVRVGSNVEVPLGQVARGELSSGYSTITRIDRKRSINITADVDLTEANANEILQKFEENHVKPLLINYPSVSYSFEGEQREQRDTLSSLYKNFALALFVVYGLLAIPFSSYLQPLIIMSAIPFGFTGAVIGHLIMGMNLAVLSVIGIVALSGVVVNDSLVMVDFINRYRREDDKTVLDAAMAAGPRRFRPILLTSVTTFVGLFPLIIEKSVQAKFLVPMAISLAFGVLFATFITLLLVPTSYVIIHDFQQWIRNKNN